LIIVLAYVGLAVLDNVSIMDVWEDVCVGYYRHLRQQQLRLRQIKSTYPHSTDKPRRIRHWDIDIIVES